MSPMRDLPLHLRRLLVMPLAVIALATMTIAAQQTGSTFRTGTDIVRLDVSVLDKNRRPVAGLKASDFSVFEDDKQRPIGAFAEVTLPPPVPPGVEPWWRNEAGPDVVSNAHSPEGRLIVIIFDEAISFADQGPARRVATAVVDKLGPQDLAALTFSSRFGNAGVPQNFTSDRRLLLEAINRPFAAGDRTAGPCGRRIDFLAQLSEIAKSLREEPDRRKSLVLISAVLSLDGGMECPPLNEARKRFVREAALANLPVHVVDPVGLDTDMGNRSPSASLIRQLRLQGLRFLADLTGGRTVINTNTPEEHIAGIIDETATYYLIGFTPADQQRSGRPHRIEVRVNRRGLTVHAPSGYSSSSEATGSSTTSAVPDIPIRKAVGRLLPDAGVPMTLAIAPFRRPGGAAPVLSLLIGVPRDLLAGTTTAALESGQPQPSTGFAKLTILALDAKARPVGAPYEVQVRTTGPADEPVPQGTREIRAALALRAGRYEIRVGIDTPSGRVGSVYTYVEVPDFAHESLSLSGLVLAATPTGSSMALTAAADFLPVTPTLRRAFLRSDGLTAFARVYQPEEHVVPVTVVSQIFDAQRRTRFETTTALAPAAFINGAADVRVQLPLTSLDAGEYLLAVTSVAEARQSERRIPFTVR